MCLSTVYKNTQTEDQVLCRFVSKILANEEGKLVFTDVMGMEVTIEGTLLSADLAEGVVVVRAN